MVRAVLYARVSTQEQADHGYSLRQQLDRLRDYAAGEGYEVLEAIEDPGYSGSFLDRPGLDRVRDLVEAGGVDVVLAQDADRISREPGDRALLDGEFSRHRTRLFALNDWGDDSHQGQLLEFMQDWIGKGESLKLTERSRRNSRRKVSEGRLLGSSPLPRYGFQYARDNEGGRAVYEADPATMPVVVRVFGMLADGYAVKDVARTLDNDGIPTPRNGWEWSRRTLREMALKDVYRPHTVAELEQIVSAPVLAGLEPSRSYGVMWSGRVKTRKVSNTKRLRENPPPDQWIPVPVPLDGSGLTRELVDRARLTLAGNCTPAKVGDRTFELAKGILRCEHCGRAMVAFARDKGGPERIPYYRCDSPSRKGAPCPNRKSHRADDVEQRAWGMVAGQIDGEDEFLARLAARYEERKAELTGAGRSAGYMEDLAKIEDKKDRYVDLAAEGLMSRDRLRTKLAALDERETALRNELARARDTAARLADLEASYAEILEMVRERWPEGAPVTSHDEDTRYGDYGEEVVIEEPPEARRRRYAHMGVTFTMREDGTLRAEWALHTGGAATATSTGSSTRTVSCAAGTPLSTTTR